MTGFDENEPALLEERPPQGHSLLAWLVILAVTGGMVYLQHAGAAGLKERAKEQAEREPRKPKPTGLDLSEFQTRYLIGTAQVTSDPETRENLYRQARTLPRHTAEQCLRFVVVAGEIAGPREALGHIPEAEAFPEARKVAGLLRRLYVAYAEGKFGEILSPEERDALVEGMGWYGKLALTPREADRDAHRNVVRPARLLAVGMLVGTMGILAALVLGVVLLFVVLLGMYSRHRPTRRFRAGSTHGGIYAETFAVWLVVFVLLQFAGEFLPEGRSNLFGRGVLSLLSLLVVFWPLLRGVPWAHVRADLGLNAGKGVFREILCGVGTYLMALPLLVIGVIAMVLLTVLLKRWQIGLGGAGGGGNDDMPVHPIFSELQQAGGWELFQIFFLLTVVAPVVEELFFRGVFYRHLRDATEVDRPGLSFFLSALACSFLFAVIHPQGVLAVPVLMSLAFAFSIGREWRNSLIPCVVAHAINNGLVSLLAVFLLGGS